MFRLCLVPWLVAGIFLSGCKSAQQGGDGPAAPVVDGVQTACARGYQGYDDWLERHPVVKTMVNVTYFALGVAALAALAVICVSLSTDKDS
jgi:hypothetical protein